MTDATITLCAVFRVPAAGVKDFQAYEDAVLPLLAQYGGTLSRRLRNGDGTREVHVISFPSASGLDAYRADPRRAAMQALFDKSGAETDVMSVVDVRPSPGITSPD